MKILSIVPLFMIIACMALVRAQEELETRPVNRGLLKRGQTAKSKQTTTTTTPVPEEEEEYDEEGEYPTGDAAEPSTEAPTSTTEGKKLVGSGVRPFRSNDELLEALKRRRAQAAEAKHHGHSTTTTSSPEQDSLDPNKSFNNKSKKRFNNTPVTREVSNNEAPPPPPKPSRGRFGRPATRSVQEPDETVNEPAPAARPSRQFRRGGN